MWRIVPEGFVIEVFATEITPCDINYSGFSSICGEDEAQAFQCVCPLSTTNFLKNRELPA
jgi:hypothetical protein